MLTLTPSPKNTSMSCELHGVQMFQPNGSVMSQKVLPYLKFHSLFLSRPNDTHGMLPCPKFDSLFLSRPNDLDAVLQVWNLIVYSCPDIMTWMESSHILNFIVYFCPDLITPMECSQVWNFILSGHNDPDRVLPHPKFQIDFFSGPNALPE